MATAPITPPTLSVSALTALIKETLETHFPAVWVKGEMTGVKKAESGHLYFCLKDGKDAQIDCVMWRTSVSRLAFEPKDGTEVEAFGEVTVYAARGKYQIMVKEMRPAGLGALLLALEQLKRTLQAEGLFDAERKRPLPAFPERIGLVTSPVGAAVRDMIKVLRARWPSIGIVLAPVRVQGEGAAAEIAAAIERFNRYGAVDLLIVGRGGGALEDLWAFNEEVVVRAIAASRLPVISAVGHEVDTTLADHVADVRAATPSNAAEIAVPVRAEVRRRADGWRADLDAAILAALFDRRRRFETLLDRYGFRRQRDVIGFHQQRVDGLLERVRTAIRSRLQAAHGRVAAVTQRYGLREWPRSLALRRERLGAIRGRITPAMVQAVHARRTRLLGYGDRLRALSPRLVLERGYCLARGPDGTLRRTVESLTVGERIQLEFARGEADARIEGVRPGGDDGV